MLAPLSYGVTHFPLFIRALIFDFTFSATAAP